MVANHLFLSQEGYFDRAAEVKPLLHLWSLAVEEQFYLVAPLALFFGFQLLRRLSVQARRWALLLAAGALAIASLWLCVAFTPGDTNYAFYLMPLRAWEFIAGGLAPLLALQLRRMPAAVVQVVALAGVALMVYAITQIQANQLFPSYVAVIPVVGAVLTIAAGLARSNIVSWVLGIGVVRYVGRISYAWYLWHWPALVFASIYAFGKPSFFLLWSSIGGSLLLAIATHHLIERPIYRHRQEWSRRSWRPAMVGLSGAVVIGLGGLAISGPFAHQVELAIPASFRPHGALFELPCGIAVDKDMSQCLAVGSGPVGLLWGDSHAKSSDYALREHLTAEGSPLITAVVTGCVALVGMVVFNPDHERVRSCVAKWDDMKLALTRADLKPEFAILIIRHQEKSQIGVWGEPAAYSDQKVAYREGIDNTVAFFKSIGVRRILVLGATPEFALDPTDCVLRADKYDVARDPNCSKRRSIFDRVHGAVMAKLQPPLKTYPEVRLIDPIEDLCGPKWCRPYEGDTVLYKDDDHFGDDIVRMLIAKYAADFEWAVHGVE
jgi:hypothetical protein